MIPLTYSMNECYHRYLISTGGLQYKDKNESATIFYTRPSCRESIRITHTHLHQVNRGYEYVVITNGPSLPTRTIQCAPE